MKRIVRIIKDVVREEFNQFKYTCIFDDNSVIQFLSYDPLYVKYFTTYNIESAKEYFKVVGNFPSKLKTVEFWPGDSYVWDVIYPLETIYRSTFNNYHLTLYIFDTLVQHLTSLHKGYVVYEKYS